jgi:uncharacterized protein YkwD
MSRVSSPEVHQNMSDALVLDPPAAPRRLRAPKLLLAVLVAVAALGAAACDPEAERASHAEVNEVRAAVGLPGLARSAQLDDKARAQADRMAAGGRIFHSESLAAGVGSGWQLIGENVASGPSVAAAQAALEASPAHYENMINPAFTEVGLGVTVRNGVVYLVQVFVAR